jgi:hypothetical protein
MSSELSQESSRKAVIIKPLPATPAPEPVAEVSEVAITPEPVVVTPSVRESRPEDVKKKIHLEKLAFRRRSDS